MKVEYDPERDLLYLQFMKELRKAAKTVTVVPGVHADFDSNGKLIGIEVLDAHEIIDQRVEFFLPDLKMPSQETGLSHQK